MRSLHSCAVMALFALASMCQLSAAADDPAKTETAMARARAEACVAIAQATASRPCQTQECKLAEFAADELIVVAKRDRVRREKSGSGGAGNGKGNLPVKANGAACQCVNGVCEDCACPDGVCDPSSKVTNKISVPLPPPLTIAPTPTPAKKAAAANTIPADQRTLVFDDGRKLVLYTDGSYRPAPALTQPSTQSTVIYTMPASTGSIGSGCVTINGMTVCPTTTRR